MQKDNEPLGQMQISDAMSNVPKTVTSADHDNVEDLCAALKFWTEHVVCRDFTKRQIKILGMLHIFTLHNKSFECYIPTLTSFEVTGITRSKIRNELEKLENANVISWNRDTMVFTVSNDVEKWKIKKIKNNKPDRIKQIFDLNDSIYRPS